MQPYVTSSDHALVVFPAAAAVAICAMAALLRVRPADRWRALRPGAGHWITCLASVAFSLLIVWVWSYFGSARSDGAFQMRVAWWLALAFGLGASIVAVQALLIVLARLSWRGNQISVGNGTRRVVHRLQDVAEVNNSRWGRGCLRFADGSVAVVDLSAQGAHDLLQRVYRIKGMNDYLDPPEH